MELKVGILGCGHLGISIARTLLARGLPTTYLRVSVSGSREGQGRVAAAGLPGCLVTNEELAEASDLVVITLRPDQARGIERLALRAECTVVSAMPGRTIGALGSLLDHDVIRIMPSNPRSIESGTAVCALHPSNAIVASLLRFLGMRIYRLAQESSFHAFTAMVCLPAVLLELELRGVTPGYPLGDHGLPDFDEILRWALEAAPALFRPTRSACSSTGWRRRAASPRRWCMRFARRPSWLRRSLPGSRGARNFRGERSSRLWIGAPGAAKIEAATRDRE